MEMREAGDQQQNMADNEEDSQNNANLEGKNIFLRDGNVAYEIERPLFNEDVAIDLMKLKADFMKKVAIDDKEASEETPLVT
jgi:hypothetical protein